MFHILNMLRQQEAGKRNSSHAIQDKLSTDRALSVDISEPSSTAHTVSMDKIDENSTPQMRAIEEVKQNTIAHILSGEEIVHNSTAHTPSTDKRKKTSPEKATPAFSIEGYKLTKTLRRHLKHKIPLNPERALDIAYRFLKPPPPPEVDAAALCRYVNSKSLCKVLKALECIRHPDDSIERVATLILSYGKADHYPYKHFCTALSLTEKGVVALMGSMKKRGLLIKTEGRRYHLSDKAINYLLLAAAWQEEQGI